MMAYRRYVIEMAVDPGQPVRWSASDSAGQLAAGEDRNFAQAALRASQVVVSAVRQDPTLIGVSS